MNQHSCFTCPAIVNLDEEQGIHFYSKAYAVSKTPHSLASNIGFRELEFINKLKSVIIYVVLPDWANFFARVFLKY